MGFKSKLLLKVVSGRPLCILQMSNYIVTCLSFRCRYLFSTVANACDLDKRVIYVREPDGQVVPRKLVAITDEHKLVGYRTYTALPDEDKRAEIGHVLDHYVRRLAKAAHLELSNRGNVRPLLTREWYDDGTVKWGG